MTAQSVALPWGKEQMRITLPGSWRVAGILEPSARPGVADPQGEVERSLQSPVSSPRLGDLARPGMRVALVIDDGSRPTPVSLLLPPVLAELQRGGIKPQEVVAVPAIGVHRTMAPDELARRVGEPAYSSLRWEAHDCDSMEKLVYLGETKRGTPVWINKTAAEADLVVSLGCIEPHIIASFGGGYKNLVPGVAGRATIAHNHALNCQPDTFNNVGQPIERNPMRLDLEEAGGKLRPPVFIVNAVLNSALEVVKIVSGHPIQAHREGVCASAEIYGARIPARADIVITSSHPMDQDLRQGVKALANNIRALRPGGTMITLVRADEGVGAFGLANRALPLGRDMLKRLAPLLLPLVPRLRMEGIGEEDRFLLYFALQAMRRGTLLVFAPTIPPPIKERLPFASFVDGIDDAIARTRRRFPREASVLVIPHGGSTYPILPG